MYNLGLYHYFSEHNWQSAVGILLLGGLWLFAARQLRIKQDAQAAPIGILIVNLILSPLITVSIGALLNRLALMLSATQISHYIGIFTILIAFWAIAWVVASLLVRAISRYKFGRDKERLPGLLVGLIRLVCLIGGTLLAFKHLGYSVTGVWVSTSVLAALFGFAFQRTLGDLFSGIALSLEQPFRIDDWLELNDGTFGQVMDMNWRATRIRGWDHATHVIPNGQLANEGFKNYHGNRHKYAPWYEFKVTGDADPHFVKSLLIEAVLRCKHVMKDPVPVIRLANAQTIPYTYMVWVHFPNFVSMFAGREELFREVHFALKRANMHIATESREVYVHRGKALDVKMPNIKLALQSIDVEGKLSDEELDYLADKGKHVLIDTGNVILEKGEIAKNIEILLAGIVDVSMEVEKGEWSTVERLNPGEVFGLISMIMGEPSEFRFTALTQVNIVRIEVEWVRELLDKKPHLAEAVAQLVDRRIKSAESIRMTKRNKGQHTSISDIMRKLSRTVKR